MDTLDQHLTSYHQFVRIKTTQDCQEWDFCQFIEVLRKWADKKRLEDKQKLNPKKEEDFNRQVRDIGNQPLLYTAAGKIINQVIVK